MAPVFYFAKKFVDKESRKEKEEADRKAIEAEEASIRYHKESQKRYFKQMIDLGEDSLSTFETIPKYLQATEEWLDVAESDFKDGAFAPFWDSIEKAAYILGEFDESVQKIKENSSKYPDFIRQYEDVPPPFPISNKSIEKINIGTTTAERMKTIVRKAQRNFQFATIYEQRKTNQILIAGFQTLAQALDQMTYQIADSINNLAGSIGSMTSTMNESLKSINANLGDMAKSSNKHYDEIIQAKSESAKREAKVLKILDNIQHHRKPTIDDHPY